MLPCHDQSSCFETPVALVPAVACQDGNVAASGRRRTENHGRDSRVATVDVLTQALRRLAPPPVKRALKAGHQVAHSARSRGEVAALKRDLRRRYGPGLVYTVHERDEMFRFLRDFWHWPFHVVPMRAPSDALRTYLVSGDLNVRDVEAVLRDQGRDLSAVDSFLEFAAGHGRFTRFLVMRLGSKKVTVADINRSAVDFARETFGVSGFYSTESAADLDHSQQYEVIFVASLFSHLAIEHWSAWLRRLYEMLAPDGLLLFSTHGPYARDVVYGERWRDEIEDVAEGFSYLHTNETGGRLAAEYYGSAFVTEDYVKGQVAEHGLGTLRGGYPARLWGLQDLYVVEKPAP